MHNMVQLQEAIYFKELGELIREFDNGSSQAKSELLNQLRRLLV